jgi:hypothetical protein
VLENRVLKKEFGPKREEGREDWKKLHNEETNIITVSKSRKMRWTGHVERVKEKIHKEFR